MPVHAPHHAPLGQHAVRLARVCVAGLAMLAALPAAAAGYVFTTTGTSADRSIVLNDVNRTGMAVGFATDNATGVFSAFKLIGGVRSEVAGPAGAVSTDLVAITDSGVMLGNFATDFVDDGTGATFPGQTRMFRLDSGVYSELSIPGLAAPSLIAASANGRWLVGNDFDAQGRSSGFAFDTLSGTLRQFSSSPTTSSIAAGVNNLGVVVGYDRTSVPGEPLTGPGWRHDLATGVRTEFQIAGSQRSGPRDITDAGVISGYFFTSLRPTEVHGFTGLNGDFALFDVPGSSQTFVLGANDLGTLVGQYIDPDGNVGAFLAVPVPEPAPPLLMLAGLACVAARARRRARA